MDFPICSADFDLNHTFNFDDDYTIPNFGTDDANSGSGTTNRDSRAAHQKSLRSLGAGQWTAGLSQQAKALLKIHERVRDSALYRSSIQRVRAARPQVDDKLTYWSTLLSGEGTTEYMPRRVPRTNQRRVSKSASITSSNLMNPPNPYNVTYDPCTSDYAHSKFH